MPQDVNLKIKGLYTAPNDFSGCPQGALDVADDVVIDQENLCEPRRGFSYVSGNLPLTNDRVNNFVNYKGSQIISYSSNSLAYYSAGWNTYSGSYLPPDSTKAQVRFFESNQNLYISTSNGVYKLDTVAGTPVQAGMPKGLDLQLSLTGASGFVTANVTATITGTTTNTSPNLTLLSSLGGISIGQYVQGAGITSGTTVQSITPSGNVLFTTGTITAGSTSMTAVPTNAGLAVNQLISAVGIPTGTRISSITGAGPYTITMSLSAIATTTGVAVTFASDPVITMSANASASAAVTINFGSGTQIGYRTTWGIKDANQNIIEGYPSQFQTITNTTGATANVQVISTIPSGITTANFFRIYRSNQTAGSSVTPLDDEQLIYEGNPNSTDISNGFVSVTDITPDSLRGAYLYTSISQQGISQGNDRPPFCKDFTSFKGFAIYGNVKTKQQLRLTILAIDAGTGIANGDTLTLNGTVYTADTGGENIGTGHYLLSTSGTPAQNISNTVSSLIKVINRHDTNLYAYLLSGPTDLPGQILLEERANVGTLFYATASANGGAYSPSLPTSGTTVPSSQTTYKNGLIVSKQNQPEHSPAGNLFFVGSASKEILRVIALRDYVIILKEDGIFRLSGLTLSTFLISPFDLTTILIAPNTAKSLSNEVWGFFDQGVCSVSDTGVNVRSRPIEDVLKALVGTALSTIQTVAFGVGYETDRKYILALPSANGDTVSNQQYVFSTFTNTWVKWTRNCSAGFVDQTVDRLYLGNGQSQNVSVENKTDTYTDYVDEPFSASIVSYSNFTVTLSSVSNIKVGDILYQSASLASVIEAINASTNVLTVQDLLIWTAGSAQIYVAISNNVQWKPITAGNPAFVRQYSEGALVFKRTRFANASINFYSDVDQSFESTPIEGFGIGNWGTFAFGSETWGGVNRPKSIRFLVPQAKQICSQLSAKMTIRNGYSNWALEGISLTIADISQEVAS